MIRLGRGDPDLDTPAHIVKAGQDALGTGRHALQPPARHAGAAGGHRRQHHGPWRRRLRPLDEIVVTPGGQHAMFVIALGAAQPRRRDPRALPGLQPLPPGGRDWRGPRSVHIRTSMATNFTLTAEMVEAHITPKLEDPRADQPQQPDGHRDAARRSRAHRRAGHRARPDRHLRRDLRAPHLSATSASSRSRRCRACASAPSRCRASPRPMP